MIELALFLIGLGLTMVALSFVAALVAILWRPLCWGFLICLVWLVLNH
jgi:hypothetical protein